MQTCTLCLLVQGSAMSVSSSLMWTCKFKSLSLKYSKTPLLSNATVPFSSITFSRLLCSLVRSSFGRFSVARIHYIFCYTASNNSFL